jgi:plasmid stabilization system protein ParE
MAGRTYRISTKCVADLEGIADYLIERNEQAAQRVVLTLRDAFEALAHDPDLG